MDLEVQDQQTKGPSEIGEGITEPERQGFIQQVQERVNRLLHPETTLFRPLTQPELSDLREIDPGDITADQVSQEAEEAAANNDTFLARVYGDNLTAHGKAVLAKRQQEERRPYEWTVKMIEGGKYSQVGGYFLDEARAYERVVVKTQSDVGALQKQQEIQPFPTRQSKIAFDQRTIAGCHEIADKALKRAAFFARQVK